MNQILRPRVMPCLLIKDGALVKTIKFRNPNYVGDPANAIRIFNEKEVDELILLDITVSTDRKEPPYELIKEISTECFMPISYGGGIQNIDQIKKILSLGVEKVSINSAAIKNPEFIKAASDKFGSSTIIVAIDVKKKWSGIFGEKYSVCSQGGKVSTKLDPVSWAKKVTELGAGEILLYSMDQDGTQQGFDLKLIQSVAKEVDIPVVACGGAGEIKHFSEAVKAGAAACATGSMVVYYGPHRAVLINFPEAKALDSLFSN